MVTIKAAITQPTGAGKKPGIRIVTKEIREFMNRLERKAPVVFKQKITEWLEIGGEKIRYESVRIASVEAKGQSNQYMQGFIKSPVKKTVDNTLYIKISNKEMYSMVIEYGGKWGKMLPFRGGRHVLDEWIRARFSIRNKKELRRLTYAISRAITQNKYRGKGQRFEGAKGRSGRVFTMNRALKKSQKFLQDSLAKKIDEGIKAI